MAKDMRGAVQDAVLAAIRAGIDDTASLIAVTRQIAPNHEFVLTEMKRSRQIRGVVKAGADGGVTHRYVINEVNNG